MVKKFLASQKKIYDSLHGFIRFDECERELIDSLPFQRLRYIHQLGLAFLVYPGATHTRFEHSLGVMELSTRIFDRICKFVRPDIFQLIPRKESFEYVYWKKVLRLAALCHDLGHLPFSHAAEEELLGEKGHEDQALKVIESSFLEPFWGNLSKILPERNIKEDVIKIAFGEEWIKKNKRELPPFTAWENIVSEIICGDFFGADRIDYLLRDAKYTGIVYGMFDYMQLIEQICIIYDQEKRGENLEIGIDEKGIESSEALLLSRHFMHKRVYQYHSVKALNFHLKRFMKKFCKKNSHLKTSENFVYFVDASIISALMDSFRNEQDYDAGVLLCRKDHFKAIALPDHIVEEDLKKFQKKYGIDEDKISWEFYEKEDRRKVLSFLVLKSHLRVEKISDCSAILANLPSENRNWAYVAPEFELLFLQNLVDKK